jgi:hypothetical protein
MALTIDGNISSFEMPFVPPPPDITLSDNGAQQIVQDGWAAAQTYAQNAYVVAVDFITRLELLARSMNSPTVDPNLQTLSLDISKFDDLIGTAPISPTNNFTFAEIPYSSNLLVDLRARLLEWVDGTSTGILPSVEQAIWDRGRAREVVISNRKGQEAIRSFALRGFPKPPGALSLELQDAAQEAQNNSVTLSRDVMIKQAELEQSNRRFSLEQAWKIEEGAISYTNQQAQRALETAKTLQQFTIDTFQQNIAAYGIKTQNYDARIRAETSAFSARTTMEVAEANVRVEAARIELQTWIQQLTLQMEAVKAGAQVSTQLAASALSAVNMSGQLGDHTQSSIQLSAANVVRNSASFGISGSASYNYSGTTGAG